MGKRCKTMKTRANRKRRAVATRKSPRGGPPVTLDLDNDTETNLPALPAPTPPPSPPVAIPSRREVDVDVEFQNGNYNMEHEQLIQKGVDAARLLASKCMEISTNYYETYGPATQTLDSYNHFMKVSLPLILKENGYFQHDQVIDARLGRMLTHKVRIVQVHIEGESESGSRIVRQEADGVLRNLHPHDARTRGLTYSRRIMGKFIHQIFEVDSAGGSKITATGTDFITIGDIPVMVKSKYCSLYGYNDDQLIAVREDPDDPGGYFIIKGKEKVLIGQERPAHNQIFIFQPMAKAEYELEAEVRSVANEAAETVSALWIRIPRRRSSSADNRSNLDVGGKFRPRRELHGDKFQHFSYCESRHIVPMGSGYIHKHKAQMEKAFHKENRGLEVNHVGLQHPFPLMILYKALGYLDDRCFWETLGLSNSRKENDLEFRNALKSTLEDFGATEIKTQRDALILIGQTTKQRASEQYLDRETGIRRVFTDDDYYVRGLTFVNQEILPHIGNGSKSSHNDLKANHIGYIVNRLIQTKLGRIPCDDRDHLQNKRFDLPGPLMGSLLKRLLSVMMEEMRKSVGRKVDNDRKYDFFKQVGGSSTLTQGFQYAFASGNWAPKQPFGISNARVGVSQALNRLTGIATVSFLRRINAPLNRLSRMAIPRRVHNTGFGYICPADTPEGEPVGFLKNFAIMAQVSVEADITPILKCLRDLNVHPLTPENVYRLSQETKIFINATLVGTHATGASSRLLIEKLKDLRRAWDSEKYAAFQSALSQRRQEKLRLSKRKGLQPPRFEDCDEVELMDLLEVNPMISNQISITHDYSRQEIRIRTDGGRPLRPLYIVDNNRLKITEEHIKGLLSSPPNITWSDLIKYGVVEFLDPAEEETALIAMYPTNLLHSREPIYTNGVLYQDYRSVSYTHCEIDPGGILSASGALVPYANHNQAHRMSFQTNIAKQAIGVYALNYASRFDTDSHILVYGGQKPLVTCKAAAAFSKYDSNPAGQNAIVAILAYSGYNQEDSLIMNTSSIQRGLFRSINFKTKEDSEKINKAFGDQNEMFERPYDANTGTTRGDTNTLDSDGLPHVGSEVKDGNLLIGKTQFTAARVKAENEAMNRKSYEKMDISQVYRAPCYSAGSYCDATGPKAPINPSRTLVDHVAVFDNDDGYRSVKVRLRQIRSPQIGDKFASRHGQKGVIGITLDEVDMPFTKDGIVPDIIINPHAIPSRMTIGHMLEMLDAKGAAFSKISDRPPFYAKKDFDGKYIAIEVGKELFKKGFHSQGYEVMYCGHTGRKINAKVFIGPCFYQRLKHMTEDKLRFRARGPLTQLGRQPICGQTREGGLRFGEMERDSAIAHGGMQFLRERLFLVSDYYTLTICQHCGHGLTRFSSTSNANESKSCNYKCGFCKSNRDRGNLVEIPYATKLLIHELMCMHVNVQIFTEFIDESNANVVQNVAGGSTRGWYVPLPYDPNSVTPSLLDRIMADYGPTGELLKDAYEMLRNAEEGSVKLFHAKPGGDRLQ